MKKKLPILVHKYKIALGEYLCADDVIDLEELRLKMEKVEQNLTNYIRDMEKKLNKIKKIL